MLDLRRTNIQNTSFLFMPLWIVGEKGLLLVPIFFCKFFLWVALELVKILEGLEESFVT